MFEVFEVLSWFCVGGPTFLIFDVSEVVGVLMFLRFSDFESFYNFDFWGVFDILMCLKISRRWSLYIQINIYIYILIYLFKIIYTCVLFLYIYIYIHVYTCIYIIYIYH